MSHILEFLDLIDVPNTYSGLPGRPVIVNATVDGVTFSDLAADYVSLVSYGFGGILHGGVQDVQTAMGVLDDHVHDYYLLRSEWNENGFVDSTDVAIAWNDGTRTLTISPAVDTFEYYYGGEKTTEDGSLYAIIDDTEGLWVFYIAEKEAVDLARVHNPSYAQVEDLILNHVIVAYVYWDATNNDGRLMDERHGSILGRGAHHYLHEIFGSQYLDGMTLGDITTDQNGSLASHAQFSITAGRFYDEDIEHTTLARASTDTWECYYVDGSGNVRWVDCETTFPVYAIGGVIAWNNAGTLTAADNNKYILYHVFATNIHTDAGGDYYPVVMPGIAQYGSKAEAQDAALSEIQAIDLGDWPKEEVIPVATVIYHHLAAMANGVEAAIQSTEGGGDFVDWRFTTVSGSSTSVNDHGGLSGLTDVADHPGYVTLDGLRPLTADWDAGSFEIRAESFQSDVATGTAPLTIASTTLVNNLNADLLDGNEASAFATSGHTHSYLPLAAGSGSPLTGDLYLTASGILLDNFEGIYMEDFGTTSRGVLYTNPDDELWVGNIVFDLQFAGSQTRPQYNGGDLALYSDIAAPAGVVLANGTVPLTADWDAGGYEIRALTFESDVATGTAPLTIASTTAVTNLNADMLDGVHNSAMLHNNAANEITAITAKSVLVNADEFVLEDSEASYVKKAVTANNLATYTNKYNRPLLVETTSGITTGYPKWVKVMSTTTRYAKLIADIQNGLYQNIYQWSERIVVHCDDTASAPTITWVRTIEDGTTGTVNVAWNFEVWYDSSTGDTELWAKAANQHARMAVEAWKQYHWNTDPEIVRAWETAISSTGPTATATYTKVWDSATATPNFDFNAYGSTIGIDGNGVISTKAGQIASLTEKTTPVAADLLIIEDSAASNAKKKVQIGNLPKLAPQTLAPVTAYGTATSTSYTTCVDVSSGPYLIHLVKNNDGTDDGYFKVTIDGTAVLTDIYATAGVVVLGAGSGTYAMTFSARTSFKVEAKIQLAGSMSWQVTYQQVGVT